MPKPPFTRGQRTATLLTLFKSLIAEPGDLITFSQMSQHLGTPVDGATPELRSALRILQHELGWVFENERSAGYRLLSDAEVATTDAQRQRAKSSRHSRRALKRLDCVDEKRLQPPQRTAYYAAVSMMKTLAFFSKSSSQRTVEARVRAVEATIPVAETLELFRK